MKVSVEDVGDFEVNDLTYRQERDLRRYNSKIWWNKSAEELSADEYFDLLDKVEEMSGIDEKTLSKYKGNDVDKILQAILMEYIGDADSSKKD
jgi:hypothetical protein